MWTSHGGCPVLARLWLGRGPSHPRKALAYGKAGRLAVERFSPPPHWRRECGKDRISKRTAEYNTLDCPALAKTGLERGHPILKAISRLGYVWPGHPPYALFATRFSQEMNSICGKLCPLRPQPIWQSELSHTL